MLKMSKKAEYALIGMLHMSQKGGEELTTAKEFSMCYNIPPEIMGKVLQLLVKAGLIQSVQGVKGGYRLDKPAEQVNISDIYNAIEGPWQIVNCIRQHEMSNCEQIYACNIRNPMEVIQKKLERFFDTITLKDLEIEMKNTGPLKHIHLG